MLWIANLQHEMNMIRSTVTKLTVDLQTSCDLRESVFPIFSMTCLDGLSEVKTFLRLIFKFY